jgi:hypothetical protein
VLGTDINIALVLGFNKPHKSTSALTECFVKKGEENINFNVYCCSVLMFAFLCNKTCNTENINVLLYSFCYDALNDSLTLTSDLFSVCVLIQLQAYSYLFHVYW